MAYSGWSGANYVNLASAIVSAAPLTMSAWGNSTALGGVQSMIVINTGGGFSNRNCLKMFLDSSGQVGIEAASSSASSGTVSSTSTTTANTWFHAAGVFASTTSRTAYLNGSAGTTSTTSIAAPTGPNKTALGVGKFSTDVDIFSGRIAEVGIWNVALYAAEIASLAAGMPPILIRPQSLIAYLPLVRNFVDYKGSGFAVVGSLSAADHCRIYGAQA